jgi:hypothetical protein
MFVHPVCLFVIPQGSAFAVAFAFLVVIPQGSAVALAVACSSSNLITSSL